MYCFEAHRCDKPDCPVKQKQVVRCWQFFAEFLKRSPTQEDCPYAPCEKCNYRLGWEIGLINEDMFPTEPAPTPEALTPSSEEKPEKKDSEIEIPETIQPSPEKQKTPEKENENIGQPGMRFCYELLDCPNPVCVIRRQQIIECFKFFSSRTPEEKQTMTCSERTCENCFYKRGWDIGILHDGLFEDIIARKKLNIASADRVKRNTLVEIYLAELAKKPLSRKEELDLAQKIAGDQAASELFLLANLKLVTRVAKRFSGGSLGLMDLIQEGNIGLIKAIAKFDHSLGYRFSTYAAYWIRYYMQKAVATQGSSITIPHHLLTVAHKIRRHIQEFEQQFLRSPSLSELSKILGLEEEKILSVLRITQTPVSIHAQTSDNDDEDGTLECYLTDKKTLTPEETALENLKNDAVSNAIKKLPERLQYIIESFYGFKDEELTLAEIGRRLGISRERTRQLLQQALQQLQQEELTTLYKS